MNKNLIKIGISLLQVMNELHNIDICYITFHKKVTTIACKTTICCVTTKIQYILKQRIKIRS
jgi:hypothetical protein